MSETERPQEVLNIRHLDRLVGVYDQVQDFVSSYMRDAIRQLEYMRQENARLRAEAENLRAEIQRQDTELRRLAQDGPDRITLLHCPDCKQVNKVWKNGEDVLLCACERPKGGERG